VASIELSIPSTTLLTGEVMTVTATPRAADGTPLTGRPVSWASGSPTVVAVQGGGQAQGSAHALALGTATIHATLEGKAASLTLAVLPAQAAEIAGRWRLRSFADRVVPATYAEFFDEPVGDRIVGHVVIRLDSAILDIEPDGEYARRYVFSEFHDGVLAFRYLWGDFGQLSLGDLLARGRVTLVSDYIQHLFADGAVHADRTIRLREPLWVGEEVQRTVWEPRVPASAP